MLSVGDSGLSTFAQYPDAVEFFLGKQQLFLTRSRFGDIDGWKHALATVRLVNKDGDVIWSTTQESNGAKFRGASADVAEKIARQLGMDYERVRRGRGGTVGN